MNRNNGPITPPRPRTIGEVRAAKQTGGIPSLLDETTNNTKSFHDPNTGLPITEPSTEQLSQLLQQKLELQSRGALPMPTGNIPKSAMEFVAPAPRQAPRTIIPAPDASTPMDKLGATPPVMRAPIHTDEPEDPEIMRSIMNPKEGQFIPMRTRIAAPRNVDPNIPTEQFNRAAQSLLKEVKDTQVDVPDNELDDPSEDPSDDDIDARIAALRSQKRKQKTDKTVKRAPAADEHVPEDKNGSFVGKPRFIVQRVPEDTRYERIDLMSGFVFYPWKECHIRRFDLPDQVKITKARETRNLSMLIDVIGSTLDPSVNVRQLIPTDFRFLLYWHRWNSYTSVPFNVNWKSRYGFNNVYRITETDVKYVYPTITEEEYAAWEAKGFSMPTVADYEVFETEQFTRDELYLLDRSQWFKGEPDENGVVTIQQKINKMTELTRGNLGLLAERFEFIKAVNCGIEESVDLRCTKFNPHDYAASLYEQAEVLRENSDEYITKDREAYKAIIESAEEAELEADGIRETLAKGGEVQAALETITLNISPLDFFPNL